MIPLSKKSPFIVIPAGSSHSSTLNKQVLERNLDFLGPSTAGNLYFNREFTSLGLVCSGSVDDVENVVARLVSSYAADSDTRIFILYSGDSITRRKPCPFLNLAARKPTVYTSPRNLDSSRQIYASVGSESVPLNLQQTAITTEHILDFFTPPSYMQERNTIMSTVQLIISQLQEPFDLQCFIELVEKESWTEEGTNFMALRQTVLTALLSSPDFDHPDVTPLSNNDVVIDMLDPILHQTGLENTLMDMSLQQFLHGSETPRQLLVFYNAEEYLFKGSPLSRSLESLVKSRRDRPTSIIMATTSPSSVPLSYYNSLDYVVYGGGRSSVWKQTLREHFALEPPAIRRTCGRVIIWSPDSLYAGEDHEAGVAHDSRIWQNDTVTIKLEDLGRRTPREFENGIHQLSGSLDIKTPSAPAKSVTSATPRDMTPSAGSPFEDYEEGMMPLDSSLLDILHSGENFVSGPQSDPRPSKVPSAKSTPAIPLASIPVPTPLPGTAANSISDFGTDISAYRPLISAILLVSNNQPSTLVNFEAVRNALGSQPAAPLLGRSAYTSFVESARRQGILEIIETGRGFKFIRLLASSLSEVQPKAKVPSAVKAESAVGAQQGRGTELRDSPNTPKENTKNDINVSAKGLTVAAEAVLSPMIRLCPPKYLPLVEAILKVSMSNPQAKVSFDRVGDVIGKTKAEVQSRGLGWVSYPQWVHKAHEDGWVLQGSTMGKRWITIGPKLLPKPVVVASTETVSKIAVNQLQGEFNRPSNEKTTAAVNESPMSLSPGSTMDAPDQLKVGKNNIVGANTWNQTSPGLKTVANETTTNTPPAATASRPVSTAKIGSVSDTGHTHLHHLYFGRHIKLRQINSVSDAKIVVNALRASPDSLEAHLNAEASCSDASWRYLCEAGYPQAICEYAESWTVNDTGPDGLPAWHLSAAEISIALQSSNAAPQSLSIAPLVIHAIISLRTVVISKLLPAMLATRDAIFIDPQKSPEKEKVEACTTVASALLFEVSHTLKVYPDETYRRLLRSSGALEVALLCWYHTPHLDTRILSTVALEALVAAFPFFDLAPSSLLRLTSTLPPQSIAAKCHQILRDGIDPSGQMTPVQQRVGMCLILWLCDLKCKKELGTYLVRGDLQRTVVEVVGYELASTKKGGGRSEEGNRGDGGGTAVNWGLVHVAGAVLLALWNVADFPVKTLIDYVERLDVIKLISQIFVDEVLDNDEPMWSGILDVLMHCTTCVATNCDYVHADTDNYPNDGYNYGYVDKDAYIAAVNNRFALRSALRSALEGGSLWANSLAKMQEPVHGEGRDVEKAESKRGRIHAWYALGMEVGLRAKLPVILTASTGAGGAGKIKVNERVVGCWWGQCERHRRSDEEIERMLSRCSRCKTARYCSADCQKADWAMHKAGCKMLKGGT